MQLFSVNVIGLLLQICFICSERIEEDDNSGTLDEPRRIIRNFKENVATRNNGFNPDDNPTAYSDSNIPARDNEQKIPMTCVSDYVDYCKSKFEGFEFLDGCHKCTCTKLNKDFCPNSTCQYYAHSFEHAVTYCTEINKQNQQGYLAQLKARVEKRPEKSHKNVQEKSKSSIESMQPKHSSQNKHIIVIRTENIKNVNQSKDLGNQKNSEHKDAKQKVLQNDVPIISNNKREEHRIKSDLRKYTNGNTLINNVDSVNKSNNEIIQRAINSIKKEPLKISNSEGRSIMINDTARASKSKLKNISDKQMLRSIIYVIANNELNIMEISKHIKFNPTEKKFTKLFLERLNAIHTENSMLKAKILDIVKKKLKFTRSNNGPFQHKFDPIYFTKVIKDLNHLKTELKDMKGGVKIWSQLAKNSEYRRRHWKRSGSCLKLHSMVSVVIVIITSLIVW